MDGQPARLSRIVTQWSMVLDMHGAEPQTVQAAQQALLERYGEAVRRYLVGALRDPEAAGELFQEFALRFVRGDFHRASPEHGRFRDYLKAVIYRLIMDHHRRRVRGEKLGTAAVDDAADYRDVGLDDIDDQFARSWREELLDRAWEDLQQQQRTTGKPFYDVLRMRVDHAEARSPELAERLTAMLGKPVSSGNLRVLLHRSRQHFAAFLIQEVADSLHNPSRDVLEQELIALDLHRYCRDAIADWRTR